MERGVNVNAGDSDDSQGLDWDGLPPDGVVEIQAAPGNMPDQGSCLYLGPAGQRCSRKAVTGGFCERHRAGATPGGSASGRPLRRAVAVIAALAAMLPFLGDFIRELIRLLK
jgi:hypothetical protein